MLDVLALAQQCAPTVSPPTMAAILHVESNLNPYAIGVVGGRLTRQPETVDEAIATAKALEVAHWNFSVGIAQINRHNLAKYALTYEQAFEPCANMRVASKILEDCFVRAKRGAPDEQAALRAALSCYYAGNFVRGFVCGLSHDGQRVVLDPRVPAPSDADGAYLRQVCPPLAR